MDDKDRKLMHERQLEFFGKITASVTHEVNNVLSIINENSGLLADFLAAASRRKPLDPAKVAQINGTIQKHLMRGKAIIKRLNQFAHSTDVPQKVFAPSEYLENIVALTNRLAGQKKVSLEINLPKNQVMVESNPFVLQQAVFSGIALFLDEVEPGSQVKLGLERDQASVIITITGPALQKDEEDGDKWNWLSVLMEELGGSAEINPGDGTMRLILPGPTKGDQP